MKKGELSIGDLVKYKKEALVVLGYFDKLCQSSTKGKVILKPCMKSEASYLKLTYGYFIKYTKLSPTTEGRKPTEMAVQHLMDEHLACVKEFESVHTEDDPAIYCCFKVNE